LRKKRRGHVRLVEAVRARSRGGEAKYRIEESEIAHFAADCKNIIIDLKSTGLKSV
jgi:hypothetical protein